MEKLEVTGQTYIGATVSMDGKVNAKIVHQSGIKRVPAADLAPEISAQIGYEAGAARAAITMAKETQRAQELALLRKQILSAAGLKISGRIFQVLDDGVIINDAESSEPTQRVITEEKKFRIDGPSTLAPNRPVRYETRTTTKKVKGMDYHNHGDIFVKCSTRGLVDEAGFSRVAYHIGTYSFTTVLGAQRTVNKFTTDPEEYLESLSR